MWVSAQNPSGQGELGGVRGPYWEQRLCVPVPAWLPLFLSDVMGKAALLGSCSSGPEGCQVSLISNVEINQKQPLSTVSQVSHPAYTNSSIKGLSTEGYGSLWPTTGVTSTLLAFPKATFHRLSLIDDQLA